MRVLYQTAGYDTDHWPDSYWRETAPASPDCPALQGSAHTELAVIGAGYAGLNAALEWVEAGRTVTVLEAGGLGWGASGRNGGFCCLGGARMDAPAITRALGAEAAQDYATYEHAAIDRVRDNLHRYGLAVDAGPEGELLLAHSRRAWAAMRTAPLPEGAQLLDRDALRERRLFSDGFAGGILRREGFALHPMKYALGLARAAIAAGVTLHGNSRVIRIAPEGDGWVLHTASGRVTANHVLIATNGYSDERLPAWLARRILPAISNIMVTRPLTEAELNNQGWTSQIMSYDNRLMLHYFRLLPDHRFLFGARGGLSFQPQAVARFARRARAEFEILFPGFASARTTHEWNGLVCLTGSRAPYIGPVPGADGLWLALGWHGNGVAAASEGGRRAARAIRGDSEAVPALLRRPPARLPLPRKLSLALGMGLAALIEGPVRGHVSG